MCVCVCIHVRDIVLKHHVWIPHGKIADAYFWFFLNYLPLLNYSPLTNKGMKFCKCPISKSIIASSNTALVKFFFFFFFYFFFSFSFFKYIESVLGSNIAPPPPPPPSTFFHFLNIVQYLFVHCTKPSILGLHPPYPTSPQPPTLRSHPP